MISEVRNIVHNSDAVHSERHAALTTLALWNRTEDASEILNAHFKRGGLIELSKSALYALVIGHPTSSLKEIERTIHLSPSLVMHGYAAHLLVDPRTTKHLMTSDEQSKRLNLLKSVMIHMTRQGERRVADQLMKHYQRLKRHNDRSSPIFDTDHLPDLAPSISDEESP